MDLIKIAEQAFSQGEKKYPDFKAGDTVTVTYKIKEENKERLQKFRGVVIQRKGAGTTQTKVRRARIYYLRDLTGKKARIKEKRFIGLAPGAEAVNSPAE